LRGLAFLFFILSRILHARKECDIGILYEFRNKHFNDAGIWKAIWPHQYKDLDYKHKQKDQHDNAIFLKSENVSTECDATGSFSAQGSCVLQRDDSPSLLLGLRDVQQIHRLKGKMYCTAADA
jgi:hypothetical protein